MEELNDDDYPLDEEEFGILGIVIWGASLFGCAFIWYVFLNWLLTVIK